MSSYTLSHRPGVRMAYGQQLLHQQQVDSSATALLLLKDVAVDTAVAAGNAGEAEAAAAAADLLPTV